jgi:hypothetical protein
MRSYAELAKGPVEQLEAAQYVYVRYGPVSGPMAPAYDGPYKVIDRNSKVYKLQVGSQVETVSADRLKPHRGSDVPDVALPAKRGRLPGIGGSG